MSYRKLKPGALLSPLPVVMVSCADESCDGNIITIAWAGIVNSEPPLCSISVRPSRYSHGIIKRSGEFVVNLCARLNLTATDLCGVKSGRDGDKFALCGLSKAPIAEMSYAPAIAQCPAYLACKVKQTIPLGSHDLFIGEIVSVGVREEFITPEGGIDFIKTDLVAYSHGVYQSLGEPLGFFGCSVAAPSVLERRMSALKKDAAK